MALRKYRPSSEASPLGMAPLKFSNKVHEKAQLVEPERDPGPVVQANVDIDLREVYFLIMHFLSAGPCHRTFGQFWNELLEHQLLPRRYHAWYSRSGANSGDENDSGFSLPLNYNKLVERYPHVEKDHLVKLLKQLLSNTRPPLHGMGVRNTPNAADVPTLLGSGSFSLLGSDRNGKDSQISRPPGYLRWPHMQADQVHGLSLREIGGGFTKHHRAPSIRAACYAIAKPSTMVQKMQNIKKLRGHRNAVYCAILDRSGRYVITGSDDRLVKIWSMETAFCLASCRGHEGDITDLAVSSNNAWVASASNDCIIRVWRLPDGYPITVLRGHTGAVTAIAFSPRPGASSHLLSTSDDGTCRIWDIRHTNMSPRVYIPKPSDAVSGRSNGPSTSTAPKTHQVLCCAYNACGTVFVTGSSDTYARVWNASTSNTDDSEQPNHELCVLLGHENDVNYVQFSGCAVGSRTSTYDSLSEEKKFKNSWFTHDNIVTCSRDGSAIIWVPKSRRSHSKVGSWTRAYHLKVPPPPLPPQPIRGGPRQRSVPTPRGVNMIVWSLDNRFVLAAIMDCRICVWNAVDGSLVHSLTGHSESTYVLDVHPFNPRIAMSAGYDGKTIIWDIWEGTPIRTYEIDRFKLIDGKFSPDGTSIILSDDVGQLYILSTGQGDSQKDAKYDQFFGGDYLPLIQDTNGNILDRVTQLSPYWRNIQDPLCDSGMIPYSEPYQSMYQQRRLSSLGIERRYSLLKLAADPADIVAFQDFQMLPLPDWDTIIESLPEFLDAMEWEPEVEVQSDDNDSEYNVTDEYLTEGEQGSLGACSSGDPECSSEDSDPEKSHKDGPRRSKRRKDEAEGDFTTSSGRRVKRRNLDERDGTLSLSSRTRKSRNGKRLSRKRSSTSKSLRPQRRAARNALNLFSRITGASTDEDAETPESEPSDSESVLQDSDIQSNESDIFMKNGEQNSSQGRERSLDDLEEEGEPPKPDKCSKDARNKSKMVVKFSIRDSNHSITVDNKRSQVDNTIDLVGSSSKTPQTTFEVNGKYIGSQDPGSSGGDSLDELASHNHDKRKIIMKTQPGKVGNPLDLSAGYQDNKIRWGEVKARSSKRLRSGNGDFGSTANLDDHKALEHYVDGHLKPENQSITTSHLESWNSADETNRKHYRIQQQCRPGNLEGSDGAKSKNVLPLEYEKESEILKQSPVENHQWRRGESLHICNGNLGKEYIDQCVPNVCQGPGESLEIIDVGDNEMTSDIGLKGDPVSCQELKMDNPPISTKLRLRSRKLKENLESPSELKSFAAVEDRRLSECDLGSQIPLHVERNLISEVPKEDEGTSRSVFDHGDDNEIRESKSHSNNLSRLLILQESEKLHVDSNDKMYNAVYKRSRSNRTKTVTKNSGVDMEKCTSNDSTSQVDPRMEVPEATTDGIRRTRSMGMMETTREPDCNFKLGESCRSVETSRRAEKPSLSKLEQLQFEESRFNSSMTVGLRSARNRRGNYLGFNSSPVNRRKSHQSMRKLSWLMLLEHEQNYRYIPQLGDEVAYLRQGHLGYIELSCTSGEGPWINHEGLKAVEFCKVEDLDYSTLAGSGECCCKIKLEFIDPSSSVFGESFNLTLPELKDFSDFLVERTRYDDAISRNWTNRDKCKVWWYNNDEDGKDGSWWDGRIRAVQPKSPYFPDSPWERYSIQYKSDTGQLQQHSPWELHDYETPWNWRHPQIDVMIRDKLLSLFAKLEEYGSRDQDPYGLQKLEQVTQKSDFLNRFPVSLSLGVIQSRLENNYYRTLEAVKHDFNVMLSNAHRYFQKNAELTTKMTKLSDWFNRKILPL